MLPLDDSKLPFKMKEEPSVPTFVSVKAGFLIRRDLKGKRRKLSTNRRPRHEGCDLPKHCRIFLVLVALMLILVDGSEDIASPELLAVESDESTEAEGKATDCRWGAHCPDGTTGGGGGGGMPQQQVEIEHDNASHVDGSTGTAAFVKQPRSTSNSQTAASGSNGPPEGFVLTARVYTDPDDKLAHFDDESTLLTLEYWECGVSGSTTSPLNVKHAYFRHALSGSQPWSGTEYGPHPQLLVPLKPLDLVLNSGEHRSFQPGSVVLLEDVLSAGHKLKALQEDMEILLLTLPQNYHHVGKDRMSLLPVGKHRNSDPCPNPSYGSDRNANGVILSSENVRKALFGTVGLSVSSLFAFFLGKVAPLWLSVGVGGTCFIVGGTYATISCGEHVTQEVETWYEKRRLKRQEEEQGDEVLLEGEELAGETLHERPHLHIGTDAA